MRPSMRIHGLQSLTKTPLGTASLTHSRTQSRSFSQSPCLLKRTKRRREMAEWLATVGYPNFGKPLQQSTNYIGAYAKDGTLLRAPAMTPKNLKPAGVDGSASSETPSSQKAREDTEERLLKAATEDEGSIPAERESDLRPFRQNTFFVSQSVLSEELREAIYKMMVEDGKSIRATSVHYNVTMERVAAVVRMKTIEREWVKEQKPLAAAYNKAVLSMLPTTRLSSSRYPPAIHEPINDLPVHPATTQQIFHPTSESRHFTRADAGAVFRPSTPRRAGLLPADARIPHPQLITLQKAANSGASVAEQATLSGRLEEAERVKIEQDQARKRADAEKRILTVPRRRVDFVFEDVSVQDVGRDGRARAGVGWRYGMPHEDRKPGQVKIPTFVP